MFPYPFLEAAYMAKMSGGGKVKPITITENGVYNAPEGYTGYCPVTVDVPQSSGFLTLEQLAALPTACSLSYGDYRIISDIGDDQRDLQ